MKPPSFESTVGTVVATVLSALVPCYLNYSRGAGRIHLALGTCGNTMQHVVVQLLQKWHAW